MIFAILLQQLYRNSTRKLLHATYRPIFLRRRLALLAGGGSQQIWIQPAIPSRSTQQHRQGEQLLHRHHPSRGGGHRQCQHHQRETRQRGWQRDPRPGQPRAHGVVEHVALSAPAIRRVPVGANPECQGLREAREFLIHRRHRNVARVVELEDLLLAYEGCIQGLHTRCQGFG